MFQTKIAIAASWDQKGIMKRFNERSKYFIAFASSDTIHIALKIYWSLNDIFHKKNENDRDQEASNSVHPCRYGRHNLGPFNGKDRC